MRNDHTMSGLEGNAGAPDPSRLGTTTDYGRRIHPIIAAFGIVFFSVLAGALVTALVLPAVVVSSRGASASIGYFAALPDHITLDQQSQSNQIFAIRGGALVQIASVYDQDRQKVNWNGVSQFVKDATVAGEDRRFYDHGGIDVQSIIRAAAGNIVNKGITSGSSTIAMQLVKNVLIQRAIQIKDPATERAAYASAIGNTLNRKLREMKLALSLEKRYSKTDVLLGYLNIAGFGGNTYGIEAAAHKYFSVSAKDVTLAQAASLVAMLQQPTLRNLSSPSLYAANKSRRDLILGDMNQLGYISPAQYSAAVATPIEPHLQAPNNGCLYAADAKFACDYALRLVSTLESLGASAPERIKNWAMGGYRLNLSIDLDQQDVAQTSLSANAPATEKRFALGASAVSIQPGTGRVLVLAQNKEFNNSATGGGPTTTAVDYNTDKRYGGSSGFATGSTYKIFTLEQWLANGHTLNDVVNGTVRAFSMPSFNSTCAKFTGQSPYTPSNDSPGEGGPMTVEAATKNSVNVAFITMAQQLDLCQITATAEAMGVHRADGTQLQTYPSAVIGTNEIAPMTMAGAIATIGANGIYCAPTIIDSILTPEGKKLSGQASACSQVIAPNIASTLAFALSFVFSAGTAIPGDPGDGVPIMGKTGTTNYADQNWLIGSTTKVALAVWVGNTDGGQQSLRKITIAGTNGYNTKFNIFRTTMQSLNSNESYRGSAFPAPDDSLVSQSFVNPSIVNPKVRSTPPITGPTPPTGTPAGQ